MTDRNFIFELSRLLLIALASIAGFAGCGSNAPAPDVQADPNVENVKIVEAVAPSPAKVEEVKAPVIKKSDCYLIVHADDAGLCESVNRATIEALEAGIVSSASIMVPCPAFEEFAAYAKAHPEYDYGIHLTLNAEFGKFRWGPVLDKDEVPSLVDANGFLWIEDFETAANARAEDVERELTAQIERAKERGVPLSHLDTHMGTLFARPDFTEIYVNLALKYDLPILFTRGGRDMSLFPLASNISEKIDQIVETLDKHKLPVLDRIVMHYADDGIRQKRAYYNNAFRLLPSGVNQAIVHLGYNDRNMRLVTFSPGIRDGDRQIFTDPATAEQISRLGIQLINWKQFRQMAESREAQTSLTEQVE